MIPHAAVSAAQLPPRPDKHDLAKFFGVGVRTIDLWRRQNLLPEPCPLPLKRKRWVREHILEALSGQAVPRE